MRLTSYRSNDTARYGAVVDGGIVDLGSRLPEYPTLLSLIAKDGLHAAQNAVKGATPDHGLDSVAYLPPVLRPEKIWCIGVNYADRNAEYKDGSTLPAYPSLFSRCPTSLVGHEAHLVRPSVSDQLDYEGEIVLIVGREGRHLSRQNAFDHIFGLTLCNEGTVRDWLHHAKFNVTQGKNFDQSGSIGPWIVTTDEIDPRKPLEISTRVNGETRQHDTTERLIFTFDYILAYLSTFATLKPGDVIATGTPTGAGARFDPPRWLAPGDVVEVEVPEVGILRNRVVAEDSQTHHPRGD